MNPPTPLLLPGNMCDARLWSAAVRAALPRAVDIDLTRDDTIVAMAERALAAVEGPIVPVGFSMGGIVALAMARTMPERIAGMVLLDTNASADLPERAAARPDQQAAVRAGGVDRIVVEQLMPHYLAVANQSRVPLQRLLRDMALALGDDVFVRQSEALRTRADHRAVLSRLDVPVLIACGLEDRLCPADWQRRLANDARHATLHIVEGAGHMLPLEQPEALARILGDWWATLA